MEYVRGDVMDNYEKFVSDLKQYLNIDLAGYKRQQMERRTNALMGTLGYKGNYNEFVRVMRTDKEIFNRFLNHMTINVSEFFRNPQQWEKLEKNILPSLLSESANLKIWSAGCSTGEEPYTLAMILAESFGFGKHTILATDFDNSVVAKASEGVYLKKEVQGTPEKYLHKYFDVQDDKYKVKDELKKNITFKNHNLLRDDFPVALDLIICRNVVIYFKEDAKSILYYNFHKALRRGGILFTGSTEQILQARSIGYSTADTFFYKKN